MIVDLIVTWITGLFGALLGLLPSAGWLEAGDLPTIGTTGTVIGDLFLVLNNVVPIAELSALLAVWIVLWPPVALYQVAMWVWGNIPLFGGKGA